MNRVRTHTESSSEGNAPFQSQVALKLLQKEEELKFITSPGRLPPKASVVAALRKDIEVLRLQLAGSEGIDINLNLESAPVQEQALDQPVISPTADRWKKPDASSSIMKQARKASGARQALLLVEKQLSINDKTGVSVPAQSISNKVRKALKMVEANMPIQDASIENKLSEYETLQVENAVLRTKLEIVLQKRRKLEQAQAASMKLNKRNLG